MFIFENNCSIEFVGVRLRAKQGTQILFKAGHDFRGRGPKMARGPWVEKPCNRLHYYKKNVYKE